MYMACGGEVHDRKTQIEVKKYLTAPPASVTLVFPVMPTPHSRLWRALKLPALALASVIEAVLCVVCLLLIVLQCRRAAGHLIDFVLRRFPNLDFWLS